MQGTRPEELQQMIKVSRDDRYAKRNECMLLVGFSFGLRVSELLYLKVEDIDLENGQIHLERLKNGKTHDPAITRVVQRSLKAYLKERGTKPTSFLFSSEWKPEKPLSRGHFHKWFSETAQAAGLDVAKQHPPAMRHGLGFTMSAGFNPQTIAEALVTRRLEWFYSSTVRLRMRLLTALARRPSPGILGYSPDTVKKRMGLGWRIVVWLQVSPGYQWQPR